MNQKENELIVMGAEKLEDQLKSLNREEVSKEIWEYSLDCGRNDPDFFQVWKKYVSYDST